MAELETDKLKKLKAERAAIEARIRDEQTRLRKKERKSDTRRMILWGPWASEKAKRDSDFSSMAMAELKSYLTRNDDRALFGLPPLPRKAEEPRPKSP
jgi:hypothetical protein